MPQLIIFVFESVVNFLLTISNSFNKFEFYWAFSLIFLFPAVWRKYLVFLFLLFVFRLSIQSLVEEIDYLVLYIFIFSWVLFFFQVLQNLLVLFLLRNHKQFLAKLSKYFHHCSLSKIIFAGLGNSDSRIDHSHDKSSVVSFNVLEIPFLVFRIQFFFDVIFYFDSVGDYEIIFLILGSVYLCYNIPHPRGSSSRFSLRVKVSQVSKDIFVDSFGSCCKEIVYFLEHCLFLSFICLDGLLEDLTIF